MQFAEEHLKLLAVFVDGQRDQRDFDRARESFDAIYDQKHALDRALVTRGIVHNFSTEPPISLKPPFTECNDPCSFCTLAA